jgi:hypothetical protein
VEHPEGLLTAVTLLQRARAKCQWAEELLVRTDGNAPDEAGRLMDDAHTLMVRAEYHVACALDDDATTKEAQPGA